MIYTDFLYLAELVGTAVFAITGALAAQGKRLDILGVVVVGVVTAIGGGTLRDMFMDAYPIGWVRDDAYLWTAVLSSVAAFILCRYWRYPRRVLLVLDGMGLALFAIMGAQKAMFYQMSPIIVVMMGMMTGCAGGIIRDIITRQVPLMLQRDGELYATCALLGSLMYVSLHGLVDERDLAWVSMLFIFVLRLAAIFGNLRLPEFVVAGHRLEPHPKKDQENDPS